jgi:DNA-binding NarL/FixJ family response regulator
MSAQAAPTIDHTQRRVRLLLADDMPQVRRDLRQLLELTGLAEVVAEADNGLEAVHLAGALAPEAVVMDLEMPILDGYEATRRIKTQWPAVRVIILSVHAGPEEVERARAAGADAFVLKGASYETLMRAIVNPATPSSAGEANGHA